MSGSDSNSRKPSESRKKAGPSADSAKPKHRRQRLPVLAELSLDDALLANEYHPLAQSAPDVRGASRIRLIAAILARLAQTAVRRQE